MMKKWYLSTLIIVFTLIGIVYEQQGSVPNQEIVLQFTDATVVTAEDTQNTLELVKRQLRDLGVENIQVKEDESGSIKITYYSDTDVAIIKQILSKENSLELDYTPYNQNKQDSKLPSNENTIAFNLDVHEIQKNHDGNWNLNGTHVLELKAKNNYLFNPNVFASFQYDVKSQAGILKVAYKINKTIVIAIDNTSRNIPEVRAGPIC